MARWGSVFWKMLLKEKRDDTIRGLEAKTTKSKVTSVFIVFVVNNY